MPLYDIATTLSETMPLIFCDEKANISENAQKLSVLKEGDMAVIIGAEGGFSDAERDFLYHDIKAHSLSLGPRILRADTAMVAALTLIQSYKGDWR